MGLEFHGKLQLASKGVLYDNRIPDGYLHVNPWSTQEERLLSSPSIPFTEMLNRLIKKCTDCPIDPGDLLLADRWHLFLYMRCLSYGGSYSFDYKCTDCHQKQRHDMDLEKDLDVVYADDEEMLAELGVESLVEPFELKLPAKGVTIKWRMLRSKDDAAADKYAVEVRSRARRSIAKGEDPSYSYRLARRIVEIDGQTPTITDALAFVDTLTGVDSLEFRRALNGIRFGVVEEIKATCENCGWENEVSMPLDKSFFLPERRAT